MVTRFSASRAAVDSPLQCYQRRVAAGELRADRAQLQAIRRLGEWQRRALGRKTPRDHFSRIARRLRGRPAARGMYLWGGVGSGKTLLMDIFAQTLPPNIVWRVHFHSFIQWVHTEKNRHAATRDPLTRVAADIAQKYRALCLDEFIVTDITDAMILSRLLHALFARDLVLITTSNTPPPELYRGGLQRARFLSAIAAMQTHMRILRVDGGRDYRADFLQCATLYHTPHNANARRDLRRIFTRLEGLPPTAHADMDADDTPRAQVDLSGRKVAARLVGRETAWFNFHEICETTRARQDYLELAARFRNVILADIPALDAARDDAARRLIELVDALYDRGVNLIVSAAQPAAMLYGGARLAAPFQRTASRLLEMCSAAYVARAPTPAT